MYDNVVWMRQRPGRTPLMILEERNVGYVPDDPDQLRHWYVTTRRLFERVDAKNQELRDELHRVRLSRAYWRRRAGKLQETG